MENPDVAAMTAWRLRHLRDFDMFAGDNLAGGYLTRGYLGTPTLRRW